jgi:hypothetical protein
LGAGKELLNIQKLVTNFKLSSNKEFGIRYIDSAVAITFITAFLYAASTAYTHGFFYAFNLDSDILDRNFHQIIYHGMVLNIWSIFAVPFFLAIAVTIYAGYKIELSDYLKREFSNGRKIVKFKKKLKLRTRKKRAIEVYYASIIKKSWLVFTLTFIFIVCMAVFESKGKDAAAAIAESINDGTYSRVKINGKNSESDLAYLFCGIRNCAAINIGTQEIIYFPQNGHSYLNQQ